MWAGTGRVGRRIAKPAPFSGPSCVAAMCGHLGFQEWGDVPASLPGRAPKDLAGKAATEAEMNGHGPRLGAPKMTRDRVGVGGAEGEQVAFKRASRKREMGTAS